jgi:two-component system phosphate regulon response regulator PhoB
VFSPKLLKVLVVEDDPALRAAYKEALQVDGFAVIAVEDGVDALRQIDLDPPLAIVLDLGLPRLAGRDVQREIQGRSDTRGIPIVIVTGGDTSDLDPHDFACILTKPLDPLELVSAVRECLRKVPA